MNIIDEMKTQKYVELHVHTKMVLTTMHYLVF